MELLYPSITVLYSWPPIIALALGTLLYDIREVDCGAVIEVDLDLGGMRSRRKNGSY